MATHYNSELQIQCCRCRRIRVGGTWQRAALDWRADAVSHGLCPSCYERAKAEVRVMASMGEIATLGAGLA